MDCYSRQRRTRAILTRPRGIMAWHTTLPSDGAVVSLLRHMHKAPRNQKLTTPACSAPRVRMSGVITYVATGHFMFLAAGLCPLSPCVPVPERWPNKRSTGALPLPRMP
jgi:hypothetical protein